MASALDAARSGDPTFVLVLGEAGIGKTAFLRAVVWLAEARGLRALTGSAIASGASVPYLPLVAPLRAALDATGDAHTPPARAVREALDGAGRPSTRAQPVRAARLVEAIYELLAARPTLLVVDDVHWADASTLTVLDYLSHRAEADHLAVVASARDDEPFGLERMAIADGRRYLRLSLPRLSRSAVRAQVAGLVGREAPDSFVDLLFDRSAGNPLFVEELVSATSELNYPTPAPGEMPASLHALIAGRVARLGPQARVVTDALAVLGHEATTTSVAAVADIDAADADAALAAAERGGIAIRRRDRWVLRHPLFGEAVAADLAGMARAIAMHRKAAELLVAADASPAEIVRHWDAAGDSERTWSTSLAAASQAEAGSAFVEARTHLERAIRTWPRRRPGRDEALLRAAYAAWLAGDPDGAVHLAREARTAGARPLDSQVAMAQYLWDAGHRAEATEFFAGSADLLEDDSPASLRAAALWGLGRARVGQGAHQDAYRLAMRAAEVAAEVGDATWMGHAWVLAGMSRAWMNDIGGIVELERGLRASLESGDPEAVGHAYQFLVELLWIAGRLHEARRLGLEGIPACDRLGLARSHGADLRGRTAFVLLDLGEWATADAILEGAEPRASLAMARALLAMRRAEWETADRALDDSTTLHSIGGRGRLGGLTEVGRAELAWLRGDTSAALAELDAIPPQPGIWETDIAARRAAWRARSGRPDQPVELFDQAVADAVDRERVAATSGDAADWTAAASAWERIDRPYDEAVAQLLAAEATYAAHDRRSAKARLDAALGSAQRLGAVPLIGRAEDLARRAGARVPARPTSRDHPSRLTPRELDVLALLAEGLTNPQVAQRLFLSPKTVGIHVSRVLEKLDVHTRGAAVAEARRRGLLP